MDIVIIGAGNVGRALAGAWANAGHHVMLAVRDTSRSDFEDLGAEGISLVDAAGAAQHADVILLAVPWDSVAASLKEAQIIIEGWPAISRSSSSRPCGTFLCVERCCPSAAQARRSDIWRFSG